MKKAALPCQTGSAVLADKAQDQSRKLILWRLAYRRELINRAKKVAAVENYAAVGWLVHCILRKLVTCS
jgi:hypothetical protein